MRLLLEDWLRAYKPKRREIVGVGSKSEMVEKLKNYRTENMTLRRELKRLRAKA